MLNLFIYLYFYYQIKRYIYFLICKIYKKILIYLISFDKSIIYRYFNYYNKKNIDILKKNILKKHNIISIYIIYIIFKEKKYIF